VITPGTSAGAKTTTAAGVRRPSSISAGAFVGPDVQNQRWPASGPISGSVEVASVSGAATTTVMVRTTGFQHRG
jgi:hypothetical protein